MDWFSDRDTSAALNCTRSKENGVTNANDSATLRGLARKRCDADTVLENTAAESALLERLQSASTAMEHIKLDIGNVRNTYTYYNRIV
jgi:hypothetical protein